MLNVCSSLEQSGQLFEHNKTKDARDHKLMRIKFGEKFSFTLSVWFAPVLNETDPAHEKRMNIENNEYLMDYLLDINDQLTQRYQRNKYVTLFDVTTNRALQEIDTQEVSVAKERILEKAVKDTHVNGNQKRAKSAEPLCYHTRHPRWVPH